MVNYTFFYGGVFSQWYPSKFTISNIEYNCAEQYMMAQKALLFKDDEFYNKIMNEVSPKIQKEIGRQVRGFNIGKWNSECKQIVYEGNYAKFSQNDDLRKELMATRGTDLVEASPYDTIWGIGLGENDDRIFDKNKWLGKNWLGEIITRVREDLIIGKFIY